MSDAITKFDIWNTVISEYAPSPTITQLIACFRAWLDPWQLINSFYDNMWNIETASGYGLDVWGRILGVNRVLQVDFNKYFGFDEATTTSADPFDQSPFYNGAPDTSNYPLPDSGYRLLLLAKAMYNITPGTIPALNALLLSLFPNRGNCYVIDNENMSMVYQFDFPLQPVEISIVTTSGVLPRPTGVSATVNF